MEDTSGHTRTTSASVLKKMGVLDLKEPIVGEGMVEQSITRFRNLLSAEVAEGTLKTLARSMPRRLRGPATPGR